MNKLVVASAIATVAFVAFEQLERCHDRLGELEQAPRVAPEELVAVRHELDTTRAELVSLRSELAHDDRADRMSERITHISAALDASECALSSHDERLSNWESRWIDRDPTTFDRDLDDLRNRIEHSANEVVRVEDATAQLAAAERLRLDELGRKVEPLLERDTRRMWADLVGPVVQLAGDTTVGSGVLLESKPAENGEGFTTNLITAWHVVRDIYGSLDRLSMPIPVKAYATDGSSWQETAHMQAYDAQLDIAVLELDTRERLPYGAKLASHAACARLAIFDCVYAVGCPLGNDPIPTFGEIASTHHVVDGGSYWMISAPTYIGNSGGGVFDARTHELIGIFSKIYTHGASRSTIVPHMGLATPLPLVYEWLEQGGHASLLEDDAAQPRTAAAGR